MRKQVIFLVCMLGVAEMSLLPNSTYAETRIALVIGNATYASSSMSRLSSPRFDADAIARKLRELGFSVTKKADLGRTDFLAAVREFGEDLKRPGAVGLFYYSGHGLQSSNNNYMIPVDATILSEPDIASNGISVDDVLRRMEYAQSNPNVLILDACRNNPFAKGYKSISIGAGLAKMEPPIGTLIAYAAASGKTAADVPGNLSKYTAELVRLLDTPGLDLIGTFREVQDAVYSATGREQRPELIFLPGLSRTFMLKAPVTPSATAAVPVPSRPDASGLIPNNATRREPVMPSVSVPDRSVPTEANTLRSPAPSGPYEVKRVTTPFINDQNPIRIKRNAESRIFSYFDRQQRRPNENCFSEKTPDISVLIPPRSGVVRLVGGEVKVEGCPNLLPATLIFYKPNPDFVGQDEITLLHKGDFHTNGLDRHRVLRVTVQ
jgi:hypothetical protein